MKKKLTISILVILVALLAAVPALAIPGKGAVKGDVEDFDSSARTLTIETKRGKSVLVTVPDGFDFDFNAIKIGDSVLIKGAPGKGGSIVAEWVKQVGKGNGKNDDQDNPEGKKDNSAFCAEDKQEKPHPLADKIEERFDVPEEGWVMDYFCAGYGMGAIMLALKTSELDGADPGELLEDRAQGQGWGQIWKDRGLIGSEKDGHSPPGLLKKPDQAGPKDEDD